MPCFRLSLRFPAILFFMVERYSCSVRITYIGHSRFPTEKAHGHQIAQVCQAMARLGHEVTLVVPTIVGAQGDPFSYYGIPKKTFHVTYLKQFDSFRFPWLPESIGVPMRMYSYRNCLREYLAAHPTDLIYLRSPSVLSPALATGLPVILELHKLPWWLYKLATRCNRCLRVVCLSMPICDTMRYAGVLPERLIVESNGVDLEMFHAMPSTVEARGSFNLPTDRAVVGYVGQLRTMEIDKGVAILLQALGNLRETRRVFGLIVGGSSEDQKQYRLLASSLGLGDEDIRFIPAVPRTEVPVALAACDVCVYPAPASQDPYFVRDTSPLKLFQYFAAKRPIVCAELPPVRALLSDALVRFFIPGDPLALAEAILDVLDNPDDSRKRVIQGIAFVENHTWEKRMQRILQGI